MPRVLGLVSFRVFPTHMGGQKGVALFYRHLQDHFPVLLAVSSDNQESPGIKSERILWPNKRIYWNAFRIKKLKQLCHLNNIDIVIAEHSYTGWIAWFLHRLTALPFIIHSHNIESKRFRGMHKWWWRLYGWYEQWIHRKALHNFFISEEDRDLAIALFHLPVSKCSVVTYGVEVSMAGKSNAELRRNLGLPADKKIFLFNGTLDYKPNYDAVIHLIDHINPLLLQKMESYLIVITGNRAPRELAVKMMNCAQVRYLGYVDQVDDYYRSADLFLNPLSNDTGVKTKVIEAIGNHCTTVSTRSGASGIARQVCGGKLIVAPDGDWDKFVSLAIAQVRIQSSETPKEFYDHYSWKQIAARAAQTITGLAS